MYAIIEAGGRQWKVEPGTRLEINRLTASAGQPHVVDRVLLASNGQRLEIGRPYVEGAQVVCEVVDHRQGPKRIAYHFRRRENWRKTVGHRQPLTRLLVKEIVWPGAAPAAEPQAPPARTATPSVRTSTVVRKTKSIGPSIRATPLRRGGLAPRPAGHEHRGGQDSAPQAEGKTPPRPGGVESNKTGPRDGA